MVGSPIPSFPSFLPLSAVWKSPAWKKIWSQQHQQRNYGMPELWGGVRLKRFRFRAHTISHLQKQRVLCWPWAWEQPRECATGQGRTKSQMPVPGITHGGQSTGNPPETMANSPCLAFLEWNEKLHFCWQVLSIRKAAKQNFQSWEKQLSK